MLTKLDKAIFTFRTYWRAWNATRHQYSPEKIDLIRNRKLKNVLNFSYHNVKYYRELFEQTNLSLNQINTVDDIVKLPVTTKHDLRGRYWEFLPQVLPECRVSRTSGSTGVPVCILSDKNSRLNNSAATIRSRRAMGLPFIGHPILTLLKRETDPILKPPHWTYLQGIHKTHYINPYIDSEESRTYANRVLRQLKQPAVIAITPAIRVFAEKIKSGFFNSIKPCCVSSGGESLTKQNRVLMETVFGTIVTDNYACNEAGEVAWQCHQAKGYHINTDNVVLEILKNGEPVGPGETGEVVITNLNRYAMPILRYANGDLARLSKEVCPCGCKLPMLAEIIGRSGQDMCFPNGKTVPWNVLKSAMNHNQIRQFQIVQNPNASVTIKYIPESQAGISELEALFSQRFKCLLPSSTQITFEIVSHIPQASSGKSKLVICNYREHGNLCV